MSTRRLLVALVAMILPLLARAAETIVVVDGIKYAIKDSGPLEAEVSGYSEVSESVVIPESITVNNVNYIVTSIGKKAFYACTKMKSIVIPNSVTLIGASAFSGELYAISDAICYKEMSLHSITIGSGIKKIDYNAFNGCYNLSSVYISDLEAWLNIEYEEKNEYIYYEGNERRIGNPLQYAEHLYLNGEEIRDLVISDNITSIGKGAFYGFKGFISVKIGNGIESISEKSFCGCSSLISVIISDKITSIGNSAFSGCKKITSVIIGDGVNKIEDGAFGGCSNLTSISIGTGLKYVGMDAFYGCEKLDTVNVSDLSAWCKITFYDNPLKTAKHLYLNGKETKDLIIPDDVTNIGYQAFKGFSGIKTLAVSDNVASISGSAFSDCDELESVSVGNGVNEIGSNAFSGCVKLSSVKLGKSIKTILSMSFANCSYLSECECLALNAPTGEPDAFTGTDISNVTLLVDKTAIDSYKSVNPWASFKEIVAIKENDTESGAPKGTEDVSGQDNSLYIDDTSIKINSKGALSVKMKNTASVEGFSFDLYLPDGITVAKDANENPDVRLGTERTTSEQTNTFTATILDNGALRVMAASTNGSVIGGNDGEVCVVNFIVGESVAQGDYTVYLRNIVISDENAKAYETAEISATITVTAPKTMDGDANGDGDITVADYTAIAHYIMGNTPEGFDERAADANKDGKVNVADYTAVTHLLLYGQIARPSGYITRGARRGIAELDNVISIEPISVNAGEEATLSVRMKNSVEAEGFCFDMFLPDEMSCIFAELSTERTTKDRTNTFEYVMLPNSGVLRVLAASTNGSSFRDNEGEVAKVTVSIPDDMEPGTYPILLSNIAISDRDAKSHNTDLLECLIIVNEAAGINSVTADEKDGRNYDLQGHAVDDSYKGIIIRNGRIVVAR